MANRKDSDQAERDFQEFLKDRKHKDRTKPDKPEAVDDAVIKAEPEWRKQGKDAPNGWRRVGDTFEEVA